MSLCAVLIESPTTNGKRDVLATVEAISATFDLLGAVRGAPAFSDLELVRPTIHVGWSPAGDFNWKHSGWLTQAIEAKAATPEGEAIPEMPDERIGIVTVTDGIIETARAAGGEPHRISDINGTVAWPALRRPMELSLSGIVNGEMTRWSFGSDQPLALLAGQNAFVRTSLSADPVTINFEGTANLSGDR